jgi:chemotaxis protein MotB
MSYTAAKHYVPLNGSLPGNADEGGLPWEEGSESSPTRHDTWLLSFIDILALLLTLFVLLLAYQDSEMKLADAQKNTVRELSPDSVISLDVWSLLFGQQALTVTDLSTSEGFVMAGESLLPVDMGTVHPAAERAVPVAQPAKEAQVSLVSDEVVGAVEEDELIQAEEETLDVLAQAGSATSGAPHSPTNDVEALLEVFVTGELRDRVEVAVHPGEVNLEISDSILFDRASAALTNEGLALLKDLAEALSGQPYPLSVEGHTDNIPIENARYPSNWELSSARAAVVTRKLIEQGIAPGMVRAIGYGATHPLGDNRTSEGRTRNRRVSFILQVDVKEDGQQLH